MSAESIDALIKDAKSSGTPLDGVDGLLNQMTKAVIERALHAELTDHLSYDAGDRPAGVAAIGVMVNRRRRWPR
jgi:putative transposase